MRQAWIDEIKKVVKLKSTPANGNEALATHLSNLLQIRGLKVNLQQVTHSIDGISKRQFNLITTLGDPLVDRKTRKGLLLHTHLDTAVPGLHELWTETGGDPFEATFSDDAVYGLGVADAKVDFLCKLTAIDRFREKKLKMPVYLVGTCGEEAGLFGAQYLIKSTTVNPRYVAVGAPTDLKVVNQQKGALILKVAITYALMERDAKGFNRRIDLHSFGRSAHAAGPMRGRNALSQVLDFLHQTQEKGFDFRLTQLGAAETINRVPDKAFTQFYLTSPQFEDFKRYFRDTYSGRSAPEKLFQVELGGLGEAGVKFLPNDLFPCVHQVYSKLKESGAELESDHNAAFEPPFSTLNFGKAAQRHNGMDLFFDLRLVPETSVSIVEERIQDRLKEVSSRFPGLNVSVTRERFVQPLTVDRETPWFKTALEVATDVGLSHEPGTSSIATEASKFSEAGYEVIVFGPGVALGNAHGPNEKLETAQIEKAVQFYEKLIERVCL